MTKSGEYLKKKKKGNHDMKKWNHFQNIKQQTFLNWEWNWKIKKEKTYQLQLKI